MLWSDWDVGMLVMFTHLKNVVDIAHHSITFLSVR